MIIYILKMIACSAAFYALYHFLFIKEKMLVFNRFYLLFGLIASFIIPLLTFTVYVSASTAPVKLYPVNYFLIDEDKPVFTIYDYLIILSIATVVLVTGVLLMRFIKNILRIKRIIRVSKKIKLENAQLVLVEKDTVPYSFLRNIFINKKEYEQGRVADAVIVHEMAHVKQKHSLDIIFIELLQNITWFNPFLYLYKIAIKINHEFLADEAAVRQTEDRLRYQQLLLQSVYVNNNIPLASSFFFITKKRLIMLQKTFKRKRAVWAGLAALPLLALLVYFLSSKVYAHDDKADKQATLQVVKAASGNSLGNDTVPQEPPSPPKSMDLPANVETINVRSNSGVKTAEIVYNDGKKVTGDISTSNKEKAFEQKYGVVLPPPPPPPPPPSKPMDLPANVNTINVTFDNDVKTAEIVYKDGKRVTGDISTSNKEKAFEQKYGVVLPPPPPPPSDKKIINVKNFNWTKNLIQSKDNC